MWNCASIKRSNLQTINAQSSSVRPQLPGLQRLRQVGLGFPDIRSCLSKAMQHSICTILWCILEAWPTIPRLDQAAQIASYRAFIGRSNQKRSQASEKLASFWLAKIESQSCKMLWINTPLNLWSLQVLTYFTCDPWIFHGIPWGSCFGSSTTTTSKQPGLSPTWSRRNLCRTTWLLDTLGNYIELLIL